MHRRCSDLALTVPVCSIGDELARRRPTSLLLRPVEWQKSLVRGFLFESMPALPLKRSSLSISRLKAAPDCLGLKEDAMPKRWNIEGAGLIANESVTDEAAGCRVRLEDDERGRISAVIPGVFRDVAAARAAIEDWRDATETPTNDECRRTAEQS